MRSERGFALLAVLWVVVLLATLAADGAARRRTSVRLAHNRLSLMGGRWAAEGCLAIALSRVDSVLASARALVPPPADTVRFGNVSRCVLEGASPGALLNADSATNEMRSRLDSAATAAGLAVESLLTRDGDGRVNLNAGPAPVLAALPGFGPELVGAVILLRRFRPLTDIQQLLPLISQRARDSLEARYGEALRWMTYVPTSIVIRATGRGPDDQPHVTVEAVIVQAGNRGALVRRRVW